MELPTTLIDNSRKSMDNIVTYQAQKKIDGLTLGAYFDSKKEVPEWKTRNDEVTDAVLTPSKQMGRIPTKLGKVSSKNLRSFNHKLQGRRLLDMNEMVADSMMTVNVGTKIDNVVFIGTDASAQQ